MADLSSALQTAKQAGYSDKDIADHLAADPGLSGKVAQARQAGYSDGEIVSHLASAPAAAPLQPQHQNGGFLESSGIAPEYHAAAQAYRQDMADFSAAASHGEASPMAALRPVGDAINAAVSPIMGPLHKAFGQSGGDAISMAVPLAGEVAGAQKVAQYAKEAGISIRAAEAALAASRAGQAAGAGRQGVQALQAPLPQSQNNALASVAQHAGVTPEAVQQFDKAGVRPSLAALNPAASTGANMLAENVVAGAGAKGARANMAGQVGDVQASARRIGQQYGASADRTATGEAVQQGVQDFNERFSDRADKLYRPIFDKINGAYQQAAQKAQAGAVDPRVSDRLAKAGFAPPETPPVVNPEATRAVLSDINARGDAPALKKLFQTPQVRTLTTATTRDAGALSFEDLRNARTWVRNAQRDPTLRQGVSQGDLQRLEGALTQDINTNAEALAGPAVARQLKQADTFYRLGSQRIRNGLQAFLGSSGQATAESAYDRIWRAAGNTGGADSARLQQLKASLKPSEWGDVAASVIDRMGAPSKGAANVNEADSFSLANFVSNYGALSERGKAMLFGDGELRGQLDNLAQVAGKVKAVEKGANASKSGVSVQNLGTLVALANPHTMVPAAAGLTALNLGGRFLTDPAAVRWIANLGKAQAAAPASRAAAVSSAVGRLGAAARQNVALVPLYTEALKLVPQKAAAAGANPEQAAPPGQSPEDR